MSAAGEGPGRGAARGLALRMGAVALVGVLAFTFLDLDRDGLSGGAEWRLGTNGFRTDSDGDDLADGTERRLATDPRDADSDGDGLADGWEVFRSLVPLERDSDGDGLEDGTEVERASDPLAVDSDGDGILDGAEPAETDCDAEGIAALLDPDDDADGRPDGAEDEAQRCTPDVDGDGVLDGAERAVACILSGDCDTDGLGDAEEAGLPYDALDPDTYGTGLRDGLVRAFELAGQPPGQDADGDGIPDGWENTTGLIDWGGFVPQAGERDLLIEFVRVQGPDSSRIAHVSFHHAYRSLETFFRVGGIEMQWQETWIDLSQEERPQIIPSYYSGYYATNLPATRHGTNPFVTTVFLNPQHDQSQIAHLGIAPIRGMLAAVDYGAHTSFRYGLGNGTVELSPFWESLIDGGRQDWVQASGFVSAAHVGGDMVLYGPNYELRWQPYWFRGAPVLTFDDNSSYAFTGPSTQVDLDGLASTIAHELGHTLGLCHSDLPDCRAQLDPTDQPLTETSTMATGGGPGGLFFLDSEWSRVREYLGCPPVGAVSALAAGEGTSALLVEKYGYLEEEILDVGSRECGDLTPVPDEFTMQTPAPYVHAWDVDTALRAPSWAPGVWAYWVLLVGALAACGWWARQVGRKERPQNGRPPMPNG